MKKRIIILSISAFLSILALASCRGRGTASRDGSLSQTADSVHTNSVSEDSVQVVSITPLEIKIVSVDAPEE